MSSSSSAKKPDNSVGKLIYKFSRQLISAGISSAQLDVLILLEDETGKDRGWLLAHPEYVISSVKVTRLKSKLNRRVKHEPLAYIRGETEFYGRKFNINSHVLEPRPETEKMIEKLVMINNQDWSEPTIADIGTGSGILAITAKLEIPDSNVIATDIDEECLKVAHKNSKNYETDIKFYQGDLLTPITNDSNPNIILANLPYIPNNFKINAAAAMEPRLAIFGGDDGLDLYRKLFIQLSRLKIVPSYVLTESLPPQHRQLTQIASNAGYENIQTADLIQVFKNRLMVGGRL